MGDNGFQGIFLLLVLFFWVLEAIASARRKRQGEQSPGEIPGEAPVPGEGPGLPVPEERGAEYPDREVWRDGHDPREGYRSLPSRPSGRPMTWEERHGEVSSSTSGPSQEKAEGMIPKGLWDELAALARGERPSPVEPQPTPSSQERERVAAGSQGEVERSPEEVAAARKRDGYDLPTRRREVPPSEPRREVVGSDAAMAARVRYTPAVRLSPEEVATVGKGGAGKGGPRKGGIMEALAGGVTSHELRRAVILHEILGPPVALRGREWESQEGEGVRRPGLG